MAKKKVKKIDWEKRYGEAQDEIQELSRQILRLKQEMNAKDMGFRKKLLIRERKKEWARWRVDRMK